MKSEAAIRGRLNKLRRVYFSKFVQEKCGRTCKNCKWGVWHTPKPLPYTKTESEELEFAPRHNVTLLVIQEESQVRLCNNPFFEDLLEICDDERSKHCDKFEPVISKENLSSVFEANLADDKWTKEHYPEIATLQWALDDRLYKHDVDLVSYIYYWFISLFAKVEKISPEPALPEPESLWEDNLEHDSKNS